METRGDHANPAADGPDGDRCKNRRLLPVPENDPDCMPDPESIARGYQLDALEMAKKTNTIVFLETGSGKTMIAIMLLRSFAYELRKPSKYIAVFLVPTVVLVTQQGEAIYTYTDLKVRKLYGEMGVDFWDAKAWEKELDEYEVFVMTPAILQRNLEHSFFKLDLIKLLVFDECHHARGRHPYACIMREFYHRQLRSCSAKLPRIFGMTASPIKTKGSSLRLTYRKQICELGTLMNSKFYTVPSESELAKYIPFAKPKLKLYEQFYMPEELLIHVTDQLKFLKEKQLQSLNQYRHGAEVVDGTRKRIRKLYATFMFCLEELGILLLLKAAECLSLKDVDIFFWGETKNAISDKIVRNFSHDLVQEFSRYVKPDWNIGMDLSAGGRTDLFSSKVNCLIHSLMEYREEKDLRCIVFVQRVITAIVLHSLVSEMLQFSHWKSTYVAGNRSGLKSQTRNEQCRIVDAFREGNVNIIFATQILEEGLDVQSCKLVIRFDDCSTVCSFIQSRGRARMKNSDYLLLVRRDDPLILSKVMNYIHSGDIMREESLCQSLCPIPPLVENDKYDEAFFRVGSTGAAVSLHSSVSLIYYYCSKLPSDMYFKPSPRFEIDSHLETCTLHLPKSSPIQQISVDGPVKVLKKMACFEACKQLHRIGALTDHLVPLFVEDENSSSDESGNNLDCQNTSYFPDELVVRWPSFIQKLLYYGYLIRFESSVNHGVPFNNIILVTMCELDNEVASACCLLHARRGDLKINFESIGIISLDSNQVSMGRMFQLSILRILLDHNLHKLNDILNGFCQEDNAARAGYLLLPSKYGLSSLTIDWRCVMSFMFYSRVYRFDGYLNERHDVRRCLCNVGAAQLVQTYNCKICSCLLKNSIVVTPHNGHMYYIIDILHHLNGNSNMQRKEDGGKLTYKEHFWSRHQCTLQYATESLLCGRKIFTVRNCFQKLPFKKWKGEDSAFVELPPELCEIVMSPISIETLYSFSFVPSIMYHIESMLLAITLKKMQVNHLHIVNIPAAQILEAITTKRCQLGYSLESLETLGDSFLKYAVCQQLFRDFNLHHEGLLSAKKDKLVSNKALFKLGCNRQLPGFIRNECFDPKRWILPGNQCTFLLEEREPISSLGKVYHREVRELKGKTVADVVEALIGAYLSSGGELAALSFMEWLGLKINFVRSIPFSPSLVRPEMHVNVNYLESLLGYSFREKSLLVEALTHGSYMVPEIPRCYQRLEFIGDSILDYLITIHLYETHPGMSPGLLTDLRSASVNNDCYAHAAISKGLHKHILYASPELHRQMASVVNGIDTSVPSFSFGWESEAILPKALGDIIESIAGAILIDSGFSKETVWKSIKPLLEPLVTPDTIKYHPVKELEEMRGKHKFDLEYLKTRENGVAFMTVLVNVDGHIYSETRSATNKKAAKRFAAKAMLKKLKLQMS